MSSPKTTTRASGVVEIECTWDHFCGLVRQMNSFEFIYRGHENPEWLLSSHLERRLAAFRPFTSEDPELATRVAKAGELEEATVLDGFKEHAGGTPGIISKEMSDEDWMTLGRHHGLVTRLLDWTRSPYVAAFFAFEALEQVRSPELDGSKYVVGNHPHDRFVCIWQLEATKDLSVWSDLERAIPPRPDKEYERQDNKSGVEYGNRCQPEPLGKYNENWIVLKERVDSSHMTPRKARRFRMVKVLVISSSGVLISAILFAWPQLVVGLLETAFPSVLWRVNIDKPEVALTFDDGPDPKFTPKVLEVLAAHNVTATFFLVGEEARKYGELVEAIRSHGHEIANHSDTWHRTVSLNDEEFRADLLRAEKSLELYRQSEKYFRPAGGIMHTSHLNIATEEGYVSVLGSAYAFDAYRPPARFIAWAISRGIRPGAIIVLHDSGGDRSNTIAALPQIIQHARRKGLKFKTLSTLVASSSDPPRAEHSAGS